MAGQPALHEVPSHCLLLVFHRLPLLMQPMRVCPSGGVPCSLELINLAYQPWYSIFLSQQINQRILSFVNSFVILFPLQLRVCDVYLLNHAILVVKLIYRGPS
jgi:hypothetical protein